MPAAMRMPKIVENVPRSRTWNQGAFTVTIATAPKDWKYMLSAKRAMKAQTIETSQPQWTRPRRTTPMRTFAISAPRTPMSIPFRPPTRSMNGPFRRNEVP